MQIVHFGDTVTFLSSRFHGKAVSKKGFKIILHIYPDFLLQRRAGCAPNIFKRKTIESTKET